MAQVPYCALLEQLDHIFVLLASWCKLVVPVENAIHFIEIHTSHNFQGIYQLYSVFSVVCIMVTDLFIGSSYWDSTLLCMIVYHNCCSRISWCNGTIIVVLNNLHIMCMSSLRFISIFYIGSHLQKASAYTEVHVGGQGRRLCTIIALKFLTVPVLSLWY